MYATLDGHTDSAAVTVIAAQSPQSTPPTPGVSSFNLAIVVSGATSVADSSASLPVAGATVTVSRIMTATGDSLSTPDASLTQTSDANGQVHFDALPGGGYQIAITPPAGSPFQAGSSGFGPPTGATIAMRVTLRRR